VIGVASPTGGLFKQPEVLLACGVDPPAGLLAETHAHVRHARDHAATAPIAAAWQLLPF